MAKRSPTSSKARALGTAKLASSGIEFDKDLGLEFLSAEQTQKLHPTFKPLCSLKINYFDYLNKPLADWPKGKPFYRLRYLELPTDFQSLTEKKPVRYVQEPNTAPVAYFPRCVDWSSYVTDTNKPLIITEGELKSLKASQEGFPTIGLGGVYNWRSHKLGVTWLPSLDPVYWERRNVYICYDSDYRTNVMVCSALRELADELHNFGAFVHIVTLPQLAGLEKVGLDDFLVQSGGAAKVQFAKLLHEAEPLGLTQPLWSMNDEFVYVQDPGLIVNQRTRTKTAPSAFKDHVQATASYQERTLKNDGSVSYKTVAAAAAWLKWPLRREVHKLTYQPGAERFISTLPPLYNTWQGWGVVPTAGDHTPFLQLLDHIFTGAEPEAREWFLRWCAYPLKYPGSKMFSSVVLHGIRHGTGKSFIGYTLGKIYGENFTEINQADLHSGFNEWAESRQFVMGDDISGSNKRQDADLLKKLITQQKIRINAKYVPSYTIPDCINYFFTANHPDSFFLEDDDRRFFIHEVQVGPLEQAFYKEYELWLDTEGAGAVFDYLLKLDLGDFDPSAPAFRTSAKDRMIANVQSDLATWVRSLMSNADYILRVGEIPITKDLFTSKELLSIYNPSGGGNLTANGVSRELARAGVMQVARGMPLKLRNGSQGRYYAVRNCETWLGKQPKECTAHVEEWLERQSTPAQKKY
jgi:hypothetical protein